MGHNAGLLRTIGRSRFLAAPSERETSHEPRGVRQVNHESATQDDLSDRFQKFPLKFPRAVTD